VFEYQFVSDDGLYCKYFEGTDLYQNEANANDKYCQQQQQEQQLLNNKRDMLRGGGGGRMGHIDIGQILKGRFITAIQEMGRNYAKVKVRFEKYLQEPDLARLVSLYK
jgi:hypothetical protein